MKKLGAILFFVVAVVSACNKNKDTVSAQNIHGRVIGLDNDSAVAGVDVYLQENSRNIAHTLSDTNGNFSFTNAPIHSSEIYGYLIYIYTKGAASGALDGASVAFNKNASGENYVLKVLPRLYFWNIYFPNSTFGGGDTFKVTFEQKFLQANFPYTNDYEWKLVEACPCMYYSPTNYLGNLSNAPAGLWHFTLDRTKNGVHTVQTDSFYVGWGVTQTDTLLW